MVLVAAHSASTPEATESSPTSPAAVWEAPEEDTLAAPDRQPRAASALRFLGAGSAAVVVASCVYGLLFIFLPLGHHPKAGWWTNWMYAWLQPALVEGLYNCEIMTGGAGGMLHMLHGHPWPRREHVLYVVAGALLMPLLHTLPTRFLGFYPFNWIASHLASNVFSLPLMEKRIMRICPEEHREAFTRAIKPSMAMGNAASVAVALSVLFLVLFYRVPSNVQFLSVLGYHLLMYLSKLAMRRLVLKNDYPLSIYALWAVAVAQDHELFVAFAYPSAHTTTTLALIIAVQVVTSLSRPLTFTKRYRRLFGRFGRLGTPAKRRQVKLINDVAVLVAQLASPLVFIVLAVGFRYGPNRRFYPFAKFSDDQFNAALVIAAVSAGLAAVELVAVVVLLERVFRVSVYHRVVEACDIGRAWRVAMVAWLFTSVVLVVMVLQMHANVIYLLQPHLYDAAVF